MVSRRPPRDINDPKHRYYGRKGAVMPNARPAGVVRPEIHIRLDPDVLDYFRELSHRDTRTLGYYARIAMRRLMENHLRQPNKVY